MAVLDFTSPAAVAFWKAQVQAMLDAGADGFMDDFGEQVLSDMVFADGTTGETMHNRYPVLQHQATREAVDAYVAAHPGREIYFFTRSGYTGRPGSAACRERATFPGDELATWDTGAGLPSIIPDMPDRAVGATPRLHHRHRRLRGLPGPGHGGDLRPVERGGGAHALLPGPQRAPQRADDALVVRRGDRGPLDADGHPAPVDGARLRLGLVRGGRDRHADRAAALARRPRLGHHAANDDEWLVGADVLAAPVVVEGATSREVWLPAGCWQAQGQGPALAGGAAITVSAPLSALPWFQRCTGP